MRLTGVRRILFSSTGSVYGECRVIPTPEDAPFPVQTSLYGASKAAAEGYLAAYAEAGVRVGTVFRFVSILGPALHARSRHRLRGPAPPRPDAAARARRRHAAQVVPGRQRLRRRRCGHDSTRRPRFEVFNLGVDDYCTVRDSIGWITDRLGLEPGAEVRAAATAAGSATTRSSSSTRPHPGHRLGAAVHDPGRRSSAPSTTCWPTSGCSRTTTRPDERPPSCRPTTVTLDPSARPPPDGSTPMSTFSEHSSPNDRHPRAHRSAPTSTPSSTCCVASRDRGGRLFICGSGGGAGHASHATCDFRKLGGFEATASPTTSPS